MRPRYATLLAAYAAWRAGELLLSRRHARRLLRRGVARRPDRAFPWMIAAHLVPFTLGPVEALLRPPPPRPLARAAKAALAGAALLRLWVLRTLGPSWTVHVHAARRMRIATGGPYRFVRHPNYAAVIVELAALPLAGNAWVTALVASLLDAVALALRIPDEERAMARSRKWRRTVARKPRFLPALR
jgi:methyltransferase